MKKINTALFCLFVLLFCSCDVLNKAPLDEIADDSFWSDETLVKYYVIIFPYVVILRIGSTDHVIVELKPACTVFITLCRDGIVAAVLLICIALLFVRCTEQSSTGRNSGRLLLVGRNTGEILRNNLPIRRHLADRKH